MKISQRASTGNLSYFYTEEKPPGMLSAHIMYPAYIVLALTLVASIGVGILLLQNVEEVRRSDFERNTINVSQRLRSTVQRYTQVSQTMMGLYESYGIVIRDIFEVAATPSVRVFPSMLSISFISFVPISGVEDFVYNARRERYLDYRLDVTPQARQRLYMMPIFYVVPFPAKQSLSGLDVANIPEMQQAILTARDSNCTVLSQTFRLGQDSTVMALLAPVYKRTFRAVPEAQAKEDITAADYYVQADTTTLQARIKNFAGVMCIEIQLSQFVREAFGELEHADPGIIVRCIDKTANNAVLYQSASLSAQSNPNFTPEFQTRTRVQLGNHTIELEFIATPEFGSSVEKNLPYITAGVSVLASLSLFAFLVSLLSGRARAQFLAERITRSQRRIFDSSQDMICVTSLNYSIRSVNPGMVETLGYTPDELIGASLWQFFDQNADALKLFKGADGERIHYETPMHKKDGSVIWVSWNSTVSDDAMYSIGRDITIEKQYEQQLRLRTKQVELAQQITIESAHSKNILMSNLSFYARTALSSILGYVQIISMRAYDSKDEEETLNKPIQRDSDLLMSRMHDIVTIAERDTIASITRGTMMRIPILESFADFENELAQRLPNKGITFAKQFDAEVADYILNVDREMFYNALTFAIDSLTQGSQFSFVQTGITLNTHEAVAECEFLFPISPGIHDTLKRFRSYSMFQLISALDQDNDDIMFRLAQAHSLFKMLGANIMVDVVDEETAVMFLSISVRKMIRLPQQ